MVIPVGCTGRLSSYIDAMHSVQLLSTAAVAVDMGMVPIVATKWPSMTNTHSMQVQLLDNKNYPNPHNNEHGCLGIHPSGPFPFDQSTALGLGPPTPPFRLLIIEYRRL